MKTGQVQVQVQLISVLKACQGSVRNVSHLTRMVVAPTPLVGPPEIKQPVTSQPPLPQLHIAHKSSSNAAVAKKPASFGNPCLDLYFHVKPCSYGTAFKHLNRLLPLAWSHDPLTTLKLICNLVEGGYDSSGKGEDELFYTAAFWLYQNHPKTLACNVGPIADSFGNFEHILEILLAIVDGEDENAKRRRWNRGSSYKIKFEDLVQKKIGKRKSEQIAKAKKVIEMYKRDPNFQLLHERVSDIYAEHLKSDIQNLKKYEQQQLDNAYDPTQWELELTPAARWCPSVDCFFDRATLLCESIARKVFPREECAQDVSDQDEEADYASRVQERLMDEVLTPLRKFMNSGYSNDFPVERRSDVVKEYMNDVNDAGESEIEADAMFPHEIIRYVNYRNFAELVDPQWKAMVEVIYAKQGKLKNCLAVCDVSGRMVGRPMNVSLGLGLLVSELSGEPWKGKVFTFSRNPQLLSIQGDDLKSKCRFMRRMDNQDWDGDTNFLKVFDLILEEAVNANLKPDQMIKKLYVFTNDQDFDDACGRSWRTDYEGIQRKFKEKGYGDVVPHIVFWDLTNDEYVPVAWRTQHGVTVMRGYSKDFVECFLDNDGDVGPDQVMEAVISDEQFQNLVVVD